MSWTIKAEEGTFKLSPQQLQHLIFERLQVLEANGIDQYDPVWGNKLQKGSEAFDEGDFEAAEAILRNVMQANHLGEGEGIE